MPDQLRGVGGANEPSPLGVQDGDEETEAAGSSQRRQRLQAAAERERWARHPPVSEFCIHSLARECDSLANPAFSGQSEPKTEGK